MYLCKYISIDICMYVYVCMYVCMYLYKYNYNTEQSVMIEHQRVGFTQLLQGQSELNQLLIAVQSHLQKVIIYKVYNTNSTFQLFRRTLDFIN